MIERYSRKEMVQIWSQEEKFNIWFQIEAHACDAQAELGVIPKAAAKVIWEKGKFDEEVIPVEIKDRRGNITIVNKDEEFGNINTEKVSKLRPAFTKDGTVTAANASTLNDGAAALVLMSLEKALELNLKPIAKLLSSADSSHEPEWFTTAPSKAVPKAIKSAGLNIKEIDFSFDCSSKDSTTKRFIQLST